MLFSKDPQRAKTTRFKPAAGLVSKNVQAAIEELAGIVDVLPTDLNGLTDVVITSPVSGNVLFYNGSSWVNTDLSDLESERIDDRVAQLLVAGTNISLVYNDAANTLTVNSTGMTLEQIQDLLAASFVPGYSMEIEYDDGGNTFTWHRYLMLADVEDLPTITIDLDPGVGERHEVTINGDRNVVVVNAVVGKLWELACIQGVGGSHVLNFTFPIIWREGFEPEQTPVEGKCDLFHFLVRSVNVYGVPTCEGWVETTPRPEPHEENIQVIQTNEVQTIDSVPAPISGTWTITYQGFTTNPLVYNATANQIKLALEALLSIGYGNVLVTGGRLGVATIVIEFVNALGGMNLPQITVQTNNLQF